MKEFINKLIGRLEDGIFSMDERMKYDIKTQKHLISQNQGIRYAINSINELVEEYGKDTNVTTKDDWIPCSERLPEYSDCYNVTVGVSNEMGYYECVKAFDYVKKQGEEGKWVIPKDLFSTYSVIAWQPLPAPYKEGE